MTSKAPSKRPARVGKAKDKAKDGTLTDRAYRELEEMIVTLQLSPGTVLSEQALALRLKIGRTPIREALQRLAGVADASPASTVEAAQGESA